MKALILVDIQNDFCPGGVLAVPDGDAVVPVANCVMREFPLVVATQDFRPLAHRSFAANHPGKEVYDLIELEGLPQRVPQRGRSCVSAISSDRRKPPQ